MRFARGGMDGCSALFSRGGETVGATYRPPPIVWELVKVKVKVVVIVVLLVVVAAEVR